MRACLDAPHLLSACLCVCGLLGTPGHAGEDPASGEAPSLLALGETAPPLPALGWIDAPAVRAEDREGRYMLLYFFQPGCGSCDAFTFHLRRLQLRYRDRFLAVGIADRSEKEMRELAGGVNSVYRFLQDTGKIVTRQYMGSIDILPAYALLDPRGQLVWVDQGQNRLPLSLELERVLGDAAKETRHRRPTPAGKSLALVVATARDGLTGRSLSTPLPDAERLAAAWRRLGFQRVEMLVDPGPDSAPARLTAAQVRETLANLLADAGRTDQFVFAFLGGGLQRGQGLETDIDLVLGTPQAQDCLSLREIDQAIGAARCAGLVLVDIGHEEAAAAPVQKLSDTLEKIFSHTAVFFSCSDPTTLSRIHPEEKRPPSSRFVHLLLDGLAGPADIDADRAITTQELFRHLWLQMNDLNRHQPKAQQPFAVGLEREGMPVFPVMQPAAPPAAAAPERSEALRTHVLSKRTAQEAIDIPIIARPGQEVRGEAIYESPGRDRRPSPQPGTNRSGLRHPDCGRGNP